MQCNVAHTDKRLIRTCYLLLPSRWKQQVSPKLWYLPIRLQDITLKNSVIFNVTYFLTIPNLIEMVTESKHVDGQTRPTHYAFIFCVLCRERTLRLAVVLAAIFIDYLWLYRHSGMSSFGPNANCFTAEWITTFDTQTFNREDCGSMLLWAVCAFPTCGLWLCNHRDNLVSERSNCLNVFHEIVTRWLSESRSVLSPACSECFSLTGDGACHFAYFDALVLLMSSVRCIDNGNCPCFGLVILWRGVVKR